MSNYKAGNRPFKFKPWLGFKRIAPFQTEHNAHGKRIRIFWLRLFSWISIVLLSTWLMVSGAAFVYVKYVREYTTVSYKHLAFLPWKMSEYRKARCEFLLSKGKAQMKEKKYIEAFNNIRMGLLEFPEDTDARIQIAQFYVALNRHDLAEQTLVEGLKFNSEKFNYVMNYFNFLFGLQRDDRAVEISRLLLSTGIKDAEVRHAVVMAEASAHYFRGRYNAAKAVLVRENEQYTRDGSIIRAKILWEQGLKTDSLVLLSELSEAYPDVDEIYIIRAEYLKNSGLLADLRSACILRQIEQPDNPLAFVDILSTLNREAEVFKWDEAIKEVFLKFSRNEIAMNRLAELATAMGEVDLAWKIYKHSDEIDSPWRISPLVVITAQLNAKHYAEAIQTAQTLMEKNPDWINKFGSQFDALRSVANYALGDKALSELQLRNFINDKSIASKDYVRIAEHFIKLDALNEARSLYEAAIRADERNQAAIISLLKLDLEMLEMQSLSINTNRLLTMRKPEPDFLRKIQSTLQSDRYIFEGSDALLQKISARLAQKEEG